MFVKTSTGTTPIVANTTKEAEAGILDKIKGMSKEQALEFLKNLGMKEEEIVFLLNQI